MNFSELSRWLGRTVTAWKGGDTNEWYPAESKTSKMVLCLLTLHAFKVIAMDGTQTHHVLVGS